MRILLASACLLISTAAAFAADAGSSDEPILITADGSQTVAQPSAERWAGGYAGVSVGYGFLKDTIPAEAKDWVFGGFAGYNIQMGHAVFGVEADVQKGDLLFDDGSNIAGDIIASMKLRGGFATDKMLVYGTVGLEHATVTGPLPSAYEKDTTWQLGAGADYAINQKLSLGANYTYSKYKNFAHLSDLFGTPLDVTAHRIAARLTYSFN